MADEYVEEEIIEEVIEDEPKPGLLILEMLNENLKDVTYNKSAMIANCRHLAMSDFFHVCIDSNPAVPKYRATTEGAQLVKELSGFDHLNHIPKKKDSALEGTTVLETLKGVGVTHVCVCGTSADLAVLATVRDLVANNFQVFVVKDAISSKNGKSGYDAGMSKIRNEFGKDVIVGTSDLLGEEEVVEEEVVEEEPEWVEEEVVEEAAPSPTRGSEMTKSAPPPATKAPASAKSKAPVAAPSTKEPPKKESGGGLFGCCMGGGVEDAVAPQPPKAAQAKTPAAGASTPVATTTPVAAEATPKQAPAPVPVAGGASTSIAEVSIPPTTATGQEPLPVAVPSSTQSNVREEPKPGWATAEATGTGGAPAPPAVAPGARPAKNVPAGYVSGTRKDQEISSGVQERINGLKASGLKTTNTGGKRMKTPRIITDTKESWDKEGNITREITRYITEPDGTKRTEKETLYIPKAQAQTNQ
jgi:hypothetical protein